MRNLFLSLFLVAACDTIDTSTGSATDAPASTSTGDTSGGGWTCPEIGAACLLGGSDCAEGLECAPIDPRSDSDKGVCVVPCGVGCEVGKCNDRGFCIDPDGLPTGLCGGLPQCASDPCIDKCGNGLECIAGYCGMPCKTLEDCPAGTDLCYTRGGTEPGVCFDKEDGFVDVCEK